MVCIKNYFSKSKIITLFLVKKATDIISKQTKSYLLLRQDFLLIAIAMDHAILVSENLSTAQINVIL